MKQIADWLDKLGMSEYTQRFVENDIDLSTLPHVTDQDLKELGVSLGHPQSADLPQVPSRRHRSLCWQSRTLKTAPSAVKSQ